MDLTEAEDIKKRWQEYTEELYKKDHDQDNHDGVITDLEPDPGGLQSTGLQRVRHDGAHTAHTHLQHSDLRLGELSPLEGLIRLETFFPAFKDGFAL